MWSNNYFIFHTIVNKIMGLYENILYYTCVIFALSNYSMTIVNFSLKRINKYRLGIKKQYSAMIPVVSLNNNIREYFCAYPIILFFIQNVLHFRQLLVCVCVVLSILFGETVFLIKANLEHQTLLLNM